MPAPGQTKQSNKFSYVAYDTGSKALSGTASTAESKAEEKKSSGGGGRSSSAAPAVNTAYKSQVDKWQSTLNNLKKPAMTQPTAAARPTYTDSYADRIAALAKPTYTDSYADRIAAMEQAGAPAYTSQYQQKIDALLDQVAGRGSFNYDPGSDPLYQAYKNQYVQGGRLAMQDTMGQAAALTGGYGSSYASTAGNQAYQRYLGGLNDKLLDLQSNALARYEAEGNRLQTLLGNYQAQESSDYNRYRDQVGDYYTALDALRQGQSTAYNRYRDQVSDYYNDLDALRQGQNMEYGRYQDALSQYNQDYDRALNQYNTDYDRALNQYNQEYLTALEQYMQWSDRYNNV